MSRLTASSKTANFNKLNVRGYTVNLKNDTNVKKYEDALGGTSLHEALTILANRESTDSKKAQAIEDLILIRLILHGEIQFRSPGFGGLIKKKIGTGFHKLLPEDYNKIEKIIKALDKNPDEMKEIIDEYTSISMGFMASSMGLSGISTWAATTMATTAAATIPIVFIGSFIAALLGYIVSNEFDARLMKLINTIISLLIDKLLIVDEKIFDILNKEGVIPKVFLNDGPAMAIYNRYIRYLRKEYDADGTRIDAERATIEANTGENVLNMGRFLSSDDNCSICTKSLATARIPVVELSPCKHKFHNKCITSWTDELNKTRSPHLCPLCRHRFTIKNTAGGGRRKRRVSRKRNRIL